MEFENRREADTKANNKVEGFNLLDFMGVGTRLQNGSERSNTVAPAGKTIFDEFEIVGKTIAEDLEKTSKSFARCNAPVGNSVRDNVVDFEVVSKKIASDLDKTSKSVARGNALVGNFVHDNLIDFGKKFAGGMSKSMPEESATVKRFANDVAGVGKMLVNDFKTQGPVLTKYVDAKVRDTQLLIPLIAASGAVLMAGGAVPPIFVATTVGTGCLGVASSFGAVAFTDLGQAFESLTGNTTKNQNNSINR